MDAVEITFQAAARAPPNCAARCSPVSPEPYGLSEPYLLSENCRSARGSSPASEAPSRPLPLRP